MWLNPNKINSLKISMETLEPTGNILDLFQEKNGLKIYWCCTGPYILVKNMVTDE